ncbi:MAG: DNA mismatch repair protein MutS, partial [Thermoplasmata archaeon]|nr:DNA mismatch repair protein MutS [Thermoplasmata archaeon]
ILAVFEGQMVPSLLQHSIENLDPLDELADMLDDAIVEKPPLGLKDGGLIKTGFNEELDEIRELASSGKKWVADLEAKEREATGIKSLKIKYNKVFGYFLEVTKNHADKVPESYIRKQTLSNAERFITPELKEKEAQILSANDRLVALEYKIFCGIREKVAGHSSELQRTARALGIIDVVASLAEISELYRYSRPKMDKGNKLAIIEGRHPVVERMMEERFIPNDIRMDNNKNRLMILTGPNMAGKSTFMRQAALITLLAHIGSFVPAKSANIGIVDRIFTRVGAYDDLTHGQSTFMVEMTEVANILNSATSRSLILLDEIGRGTSTFDGLSIAWAVAEYIESKRVGAKAIFATHYHHLTELEELLDGVVNYNIAVKEDKDDIIFLRKVIPGSTNRSYGVQVAKLAGLPVEVITRAKQILKRIEAEAIMELEEGGRKKGKRRTYTQLVLFDQMMAENPIITELKGMDPDHMTPMEALHKLQELKKKLDDD